MSSYTTQMDAARKGILTPQMKRVAQKEHMPEETLMKFIGPPLQDSFREFCGFTEEEALRGIRLFRER